jgi:hypothetical protein
MATQKQWHEHVLAWLPVVALCGGIVAQWTLLQDFRERTTQDVAALQAKVSATDLTVQEIRSWRDSQMEFFRGVKDHMGDRSIHANPDSQRAAIREALAPLAQDLAKLQVQIDERTKSTDTRLASLELLIRQSLARDPK